MGTHQYGRCQTLKEEVSMHRFFADKSQFNGTQVEILGEDVNHISKVLRLKKGDKVSVCDKEKTDYICSVNTINKESVLLDVLERMPNLNESNLNITLYQGIPKGDKMDYIIQKCVELGVCKIVPVVMKRTVVKMEKSENKLKRWQRISDEASKQCMRGILPEVSFPISFEEMLGEIDKESLTLLPYENEHKTRLKDVLKNNADKDKINIIIGPEGGFDEEEIALSKEKSISTVTLGPRIMRCETAPVASLSAVMYELGDW